MNIGSSIPALSTQWNNLVSGSSETGSPTSFADLFKTAIGNVDGLQGTADSKISGLVQGAPNTEVGDVMVSVEKADVAFQLMMQVRNKVVSAYQDIEKMQF